MVIAFQVILLIVIIGTLGNITDDGKGDKPVNAGVGIAAMISFIVSVVWL